MTRPRRLLAPSLLLCVAGSLIATAALAEPVIKRVAAPHVAGVDGAVLYQAYCASCHGAAAAGDGPAATALGTRVPDLRRIAARDEGYHATHVYTHLRWAAGETMPDVNKILRANYPDDPNASHMATRNLAAYIATLQTR
jgi:mono/diheme cytochrome c family protein